MFSLAILICSAIVFYRIGETDYGRGGLLCIISILVSFASNYLVPLPFISIVIGQVFLFMALLVYNFMKKKPPSSHGGL